MKNLCNLMVHLIAWFLVSKYFGKKWAKHLIIYFKNLKLDEGYSCLSVAVPAGATPFYKAKQEKQRKLEEYQEYCRQARSRDAEKWLCFESWENELYFE